MTDTVRAAGCVVWRRSAISSVEILIIHRDRYDDWSFPKGKLDEGETELQCALREVREETNIRGTVGKELPVVSYVDHRGRPKTVRYWLLTFGEGEFVANDEVDQVLWLSPVEARGMLSYAHDMALLDAAALEVIGGG